MSPVDPGLFAAELGVPVADLASKLPFGPGHPLWIYWTRGEGAAKWKSSPTPWTTLHALLLKYIGPQAAGLTTNVMLATPGGRALFKLHHKGKGAHSDTGGEHF